MRLPLLLVVLIISFLGISNLKAQPPAVKPGAALTYKIIPANQGTWGYDIYTNDKLYVHQPTIPAVPGNKGFETKAAAEKTAKKVIEKIKKGENPPSLTIDEMKKLGVLPKQ